MHTNEPKDIVAALRGHALVGHQEAVRLSPADQEVVHRDLMWLAADEIERPRGVIARNCDPEKAATPSGRHLGPSLKLTC